MTLLATAGHLHPGGLYTDLKATRGGEHQGAVPLGGEVLRAGRRRVVGRLDDRHQADWKIAVKKGDRLNVSATYDTRKASWYESMGIMVVFVADGIKPGAKDPFKSSRSTPAAS